MNLARETDRTATPTPEVTPPAAPPPPRRRRPIGTAFALIAAHGLVGLGTVVAVVAVLVLVFPAVPSLTAGERNLTVTDLDDLRTTDDLGAGDLTLDLRERVLPSGTTTIEARVGLGQLEVRR